VPSAAVQPTVPIPEASMAQAPWMTNPGAFMLPSPWMFPAQNVAPGFGGMSMPHVIPQPQHTSTPYKRPASSPSSPSDNHHMFSSPAKASHTAISYPKIEDWLSSLKTDLHRGVDNVDYAAYADVFLSEGILRLDDLIDLRRGSEIQNISNGQIRTGTGNRLLRWAKEDQKALLREAGAHKKARLS
jgi:hypothetical protein